MVGLKPEKDRDKYYKYNFSLIMGRKTTKRKGESSDSEFDEAELPTNNFQRHQQKVD